MNPDWSQSALKDLSFWLIEVRTLCVSNPEAKGVVLGKVADAPTRPDVFATLDVVQFAQAHNLTLSEARLTRMAKTLFRLSEGVEVSALSSLDGSASGSWRQLRQAYEDVFIKDSCA